MFSLYKTNQEQKIEQMRHQLENSRITVKKDKPFFRETHSKDYQPFHVYDKSRRRGNEDREMQSHSNLHQIKRFKVRNASHETPRNQSLSISRKDDIMNLKTDSLHELDNLQSKIEELKKKKVKASVEGRLRAKVTSLNRSDHRKVEMHSKSTSKSTKFGSSFQRSIKFMPLDDNSSALNFSSLVATKSNKSSSIADRSTKIENSDLPSPYLL